VHGRVCQRRSLWAEEDVNRLARPEQVTGEVERGAEGARGLAQRQIGRNDRERREHGVGGHAVARGIGDVADPDLVITGG